MGPGPSDTGARLTSCLALGCARCKPVLGTAPALQLLSTLIAAPGRGRRLLEGLAAVVPGPQVPPTAPFYLLQGCEVPAPAIVSREQQ